MTKKKIMSQNKDDGLITVFEQVIFEGIGQSTFLDEANFDAEDVFNSLKHKLDRH